MIVKHVEGNFDHRWFQISNKKHYISGLFCQDFAQNLYFETGSKIHDKPNKDAHIPEEEGSPLDMT